MHRIVLPAVLLALLAMSLGAVATIAQDDEPFVTGDDDGSVLVGIRNDVAIPADAESDGILIVQGEALVEGVARTIVAIDADVTVRGPAADVAGILSFGGSLTVADGATVEDIGYVDTDISGVEATLVTGEVNDVRTNVASFYVWAVAWIAILLFFVWIGVWIATLAAGLFMVAIGASQARRAAWAIGHDPLKVLAVGALAAILPWILFAVLALTVVGLPLAVGLAIIWLVVVFLGYLTVGLWIGERILRRSRYSNRPYGAVFLGVLILLLLSWLPIVTALAAWVGLGAVTLAGWRVLRGRGAPTAPPGYGAPYGQPYAVPPPPYAPPPYAPPPPQYPPQYPPPAGWT